MKDTSKRTLSNVFVGQFSNARAIEGAKTAPWWIAVILFVLGTFLPIVPIMVTQSGAYGAQFISGTLYGYDQTVATTTQDLGEAENTIYRIVNHQLLKYNKTAEGYEEDPQNTWVDPIDPTAPSPDMTPIAWYDEQVKVTIEGVEQLGLRRRLNVFYTNRPYSGNGDSNIATMLKTLTNRAYDKESVIPEPISGDIDSSKKSNYYNASFIILAKEGIYSYIYKTGTLELSTYTGTGMDWSYQDDTVATLSNPNKNFLKELSTVEGIPAAEANPKNEKYVKGVLENWKSVYNKAYNKLKNRNFWMITGIFYAIFVVLNLFMGLMLWLLTRGKRNPNRGLKMHTCLSIAGWTCFMPGLLALILGFLIPAAQQIAFIMLIGLRTMWLAMRQLNPKY